MTDANRKDELELERFFAAARAMPAEPSDTLMARVLEDALTAQTGFVSSRTALGAPDGNAGFWGSIWAALGGWPAMAGLATAVAAGVVIGVSPALGLGETVAGVWDNTGAESYLVDIAPGLGFDLGQAQGEGDAG